MEDEGVYIVPLKPFKQAIPRGPDQPIAVAVEKQVTDETPIPVSPQMAKLLIERKLARACEDDDEDSGERGDGSEGDTTSNTDSEAGNSWKKNGE